MNSLLSYLLPQMQLRWKERHPEAFSLLEEVNLLVTEDEFDSGPKSRVEVWNTLARITDLLSQGVPSSLIKKALLTPREESVESDPVSSQPRSTIRYLSSRMFHLGEVYGHDYEYSGPYPEDVFRIIMPGFWSYFPFEKRPKEHDIMSYLWSHRCTRENELDYLLRLQDELKEELGSIPHDWPGTIGEVLRTNGQGTHPLWNGKVDHLRAMEIAATQKLMTLEAQAKADMVSETQRIPALHEQVPSIQEILAAPWAVRLCESPGELAALCEHIEEWTRAVLPDAENGNDGWSPVPEDIRKIIRYLRRHPAEDQAFIERYFAKQQFNYNGRSMELTNVFWALAEESLSCQAASLADKKEISRRVNRKLTE